MPAEARAGAPAVAPARTAALTALAMLAFAANSLLCRAALAGGHADAFSFTTLRLASGALTLGVLARARGGAAPARWAAWGAALSLFAYAILFSLAYLRIPAGTGALLLFGAVQLTMIAASVRAGEPPRALEWAGFALALGGLVLLTLPGLSRPDPTGLLAMIGAGIGWGVYSLLGRSGFDPIAANASGFARALAFALATSVGAALTIGARLTAAGALYAVVSGALTSGLGYAIWYAALRGLAATSAGIVQLSVPPLAAGLGVALLGEQLSPRLGLASALVLGGIALAVATRRRPSLVLHETRDPGNEPKGPESLD